MAHPLRCHYDIQVCGTHYDVQVCGGEMREREVECFEHCRERWNQRHKGGEKQHDGSE